MRARFLPGGEPQRTPNEGHSIRVHGAKLYLDSPRLMHGVKVEAHIDADGWLTVEVEADDSVKGWALSFNGDDFPTTDAGLRAELELARAENRREVGLDA